MTAVPTLSQMASSAHEAAGVNVVAGARTSRAAPRPRTCGIYDQRPQGDLRPPHTHLTPQLLCLGLPMTVATEVSWALFL